MLLTLLRSDIYTTEPAYERPAALGYRPVVVIAKKVMVVEASKDRGF